MTIEERQQEIIDSLDRRTTTLILAIFALAIAIGLVDASRRDKIETLEKRIEALEQKEVKR